MAQIKSQENTLKTNLYRIPPDFTAWWGDNSSLKKLFTVL